MNNDTQNGDTEREPLSYDPILIRSAVRKEGGNVIGLEHEIVVRIDPKFNERFFEHLFGDAEIEAEMLLLSFIDAIVIFRDVAETQHGITLRQKGGVHFETSCNGKAVHHLNAVFETDAAGLAIIRDFFEMLNFQFSLFEASQMEAAGLS